MTAHRDATNWIAPTPPPLGHKDCSRGRISTASATQDCRSTQGNTVASRNWSQLFPKCRLSHLEDDDLSTPTLNLDLLFGHNDTSASQTVDWKEGETHCPHAKSVSTRPTQSPRESVHHTLRPRSSRSTRQASRSSTFSCGTGTRTGITYFRSLFAPLLVDCTSTEPHHRPPQCRNLASAATQ